MLVPDIVQTIHAKLKSIGAEAIIVGGYVRDTLMDISESKDIDIEVYGLEDIEMLKKQLETIAQVHEVGKSFGVLKMNSEEYDLDISLPRTESKTGQGHRGFAVSLEADMSFVQASIRRDFTMNAIGYDISNKIYLDPHHGQEDIANKCIRMVNKKSFIEDPLRVLRAVQFSGRFGFDLEPETLHLCQSMVNNKMLDELPKERIFEEFKKLILKSTKPSRGFLLLDKIGALFPEIKALQGVKQNPQYHPEGDVFVHTMMSIDALAKEDIRDEKEKLIVMLAVLCHDFGKPESTQIMDDKITAINHEKVGLEPTRIFIQRLSDEIGLYESVAPLVEHHLKPSQFYAQKSKSSAVRRLSTKVNIEQLIQVSKADFLGRTTKEAQSGVYEAGAWLYKEAHELQVLTQGPKAILQGRDLIDMGLEPGIAFKKILNQAYEDQLNGKFSDLREAKKWLKEYLSIQKEYLKINKV